MFLFKNNIFNLAKSFIIVTTCLCPFVSKGFSMEYEMQLTKTNEIQPHHHHRHHPHHLQYRIVLGPENAPEGIIEFHGPKEMPEDVKAYPGEVQVMNLEHRNFHLISKALFSGASVSIDWDESNSAAMIYINSDQN